MRPVLVFSLVAAMAAPAGAYVPERTPPRHANAAGRAAIGAPAASERTTVVITRGGATLFAVNASDPMVPASLMKLPTTTTAMLRYGPGHRFATRVAVAGRDLFLIGGGDPTLATEAYRRDRFLPGPRDPLGVPVFPSGSPTVEDIARAVERAGVRRVRTLFADGSRFDARRVQPGWLPRYLIGEPDTGYLDALTVNEGRASRDRRRLFASPALGAGRMLRTALERRGIAVGAVRAGRAPAGAAEIARVVSPPLREIVDYVNRYSINYPAEFLLKNLGADHGEHGTTAAGSSVVRATMRELGVPLRGVHIADGSGLSVDDRLTGRAIATLLERIASGRGAPWPALRASIPAAGEPGTLLHRMTGPGTRGNLRGKTGYLRGVRAMAGWVRGADGVPLVYVALYNRTPSPLALTGPLDRLGTALSRYPWS